MTDTMAVTSGQETIGPALTVRPFAAGSDEQAWDELVGRSCNGTFLHTRRFLSYHGERFADRSLLIEDGRGRLRGVFPAATAPTVAAGARVISHPGITYGGVVHDGFLRGDQMIEALGLICDAFRRQGASSLLYRVVPPIYHRTPAQDDVYALFRLGAVRTRCDLSATVDLAAERHVTKGRKSMRAVARRHGVRVETGWDHSQAFWDLLEQNLDRRYGTRPVHSHEEMALLAGRFPDRMALHCAFAGGELLAGGVAFATGPTIHLQYAAAGERGREVGALDAVVEAVIETGIRQNFRYFDYGISTEQGGQVLNSSLHRYKSSFGAGGVTYEHYEVQL